MRAKLLGLALAGAVLTGACADGGAPRATVARAEAGAATPTEGQDAAPSVTGLAAELNRRYFLLVSAEGFEQVAGTGSSSRSKPTSTGPAPTATCCARGPS